MLTPEDPVADEETLGVDAAAPVAPMLVSVRLDVTGPVIGGAIGTTWLIDVGLWVSTLELELLVEDEDEEGLDVDEGDDDNDDDDDKVEEEDAVDELEEDDDDDDDDAELGEDDELAEELVKLTLLECVAVGSGIDTVGMKGTEIDGTGQLQC